MEIHVLIILFKILIWIAVAFRNVNKELFYFFLVLAFIDPAVFIAKSFISISNNIMYIPLNLLLFLVMRPSKKSFISAVTIIVLLLSFEFSREAINISIMLIHFFIAGLFINLTINEIYIRQRISLFYPLLFLYAVMTIVKAWLYTFDALGGLTSFFFFNSVQIVLGIFFIFYSNEKSPRLSLDRIFS